MHVIKRLCKLGKSGLFKNCMSERMATAARLNSHSQHKFQQLIIGCATP